MSTTVTTPPRSLSLSKDDSYLVATSDLMAYRPALVRLNCSDPAAPADGNTFVFTWSGTTLTFTWATTPDASGLQLPTRGGGESATDYRARLEEAFRQNEVLVRNWEIINSSANAAIRFRYRVGETLDITATSDASGMEAVIEDEGSPVMQEDNLRCLLQLYNASDTSTDTPFVSLEAAYTTRSPYEAVFNLRELAPVGPYLPPTSSLAATVPGLNDYTEFQANGAYAQLYYRIADKYGSPPAAEALVKYGDFYVVYGGSAGDSRRIWGSTAQRFWLAHSYYDRNGLAYAKPIAENQPDYVFVWVGANAQTVGLEVAIDYSDGTTEELPVPGTGTITLNANTLYCFPAGPLQLALSEAPSWDSKTPVGYEFRITNSTYALTLLSVSYSLHQACAPWEVVLAFWNGVGGLETVVFDGKSNYSYEASRDTFQRIRTKDYSPDLGELIAYDVQGVQRWELNTSYLPRDYVEHLRQLLVGETWLVDRNNLRFLRVQVSDSSISSPDDDELYSLSITIRLSTTDESYHRL
jgi:hypothetical protein